jgi:hypothetical protein
LSRFVSLAFSGSLPRLLKRRKIDRIAATPFRPDEQSMTFTSPIIRNRFWIVAAADAVTALPLILVAFAAVKVSLAGLLIVD